ncbi:hypothetical protein Xvie_03788 [Xenorhabdus vietnamensis]|uniref:Uncharacterized protein n=1 Tax=Xenorhabdus vietnamensis TaxID=351656 RepID=A0A1Y2S6V8_9GAMM|nr:hypothetical protein [Xenorhabdus vietnamensis]OTA14327.1 hypothetical protein Xvie_03788 [Xenorhabdus vietnamensis]
MLSFALEIGVGRYSKIEQDWGYLADDEFASGPDHEGSFGILTKFQNKTDITNFSYFAWINGESGWISTTAVFVFLNRKYARRTA